MTRNLFKVHVGRKGYLHFATLADAKAFCEEVFQRSKIVLSITEVR